MKPFYMLFNGGAGSGPRPHTYFKGDRAEYTGNKNGDLHELEIMEGHRQGEKVHTAVSPGGTNPFHERNKQEWAAQQADFRKLNQ